MEFAMRYSHALHEAGYAPTLKRLAELQPSKLPQDTQQLALFAGGASGGSTIAALLGRTDLDTRHAMELSGQTSECEGLGK